MTERVSAADVGFLHRETRTSPQHTGGIVVLDAGSLDYDRLVRLLEERISLAPRYRQKVRIVPGHLANPVWVDDPSFDITYHVRRSALPRPGTEAQLLEFCARIQSRLLDRSRPLWEMYLIEGLADERVAILTKTHAAMVGEQGDVDLAQVILDASPAPRRTVEAIWMPEPEPTALELVVDAAFGLVSSPRAVLDTAQTAARDAGSVAKRVFSLTGSLAANAGAVLSRPSNSPLHVTLGEQRRLAIARTRFADYRAVRDVFGGTVNDVALAVVTGALRSWLLSRAVGLKPAATVRALVPMAVADLAVAPPPGAPSSVTPGRATPPGTARRSSVRPLLVDLPVGEPDPVLRLAQLRYAMASHKATGRAVSADELAELAGFAPPTMHALGVRASSELTRRLFSLVITNVPGPQVPLYAAGARMSEMFPFLPLAQGQALSVALTSYDGGVYFGINADYDAVPDAAAFADLIEEAVAELVATLGPTIDDARGPSGDRRGARTRSTTRGSRS